MAPLRNHLVAKGYRVAMPLLSGHGGGLEELHHSTWQDWYATVRTSFAELRRDANKIYVAGISLGSLLALKLAIDEGWGVRALALMSLCLVLRRSTRASLAAVRYSPLRWLIRSVGKNFTNSVARPEGREMYASFTAPRLSLCATYEILNLQKHIRNHLGEVSSPMLLLHGRDDHTAPPSNVSIVRHLAAADVVEAKFFDRSRHILTLDWDSDEVIRSIADFFERFA